MSTATLTATYQAQGSALVPARAYRVTTTMSEFTGVLVGLSTNVLNVTTATFVPFHEDLELLEMVLPEVLDEEVMLLERTVTRTGRHVNVVLGEITRIEQL